MIEEVINSILDAEDVAKRRVEEAESKAAEIVSAAETEAESRKKQSAKDNKALYVQKLREADALAESKAAEVLKTLNAETDKEITSYAKNVEKAVKIIIEAK